MLTHKEGLYAKAVTGEGELGICLIPKRKSKDPIEVLKGAYPLVNEQVKEELCVAVTFKLYTIVSEATTQALLLVQLPIIAQRVAPTGAEHGLVARVAEVTDREASVA
jgi:hypothetical protein